LRYTSAIPCAIVTRDVTMPKMVMHLFLTRLVSTGQDGHIFLLLQNSYQRPNCPINLSHVKKQGQIGHYIPRNMKNSKRMQILMWFLDGAHKIAATERMRSKR